MNRIRKLSVYFLLFCILGLNITSSNLAFGIAKYPSYDNLFLNEDKYETFNRKMFNLNLKLNRVFVVRLKLNYILKLDILNIEFCCIYQCVLHNQ